LKEVRCLEVAMNTTTLDPRVSEFETQEQADSYDRWFRAKVQEALDSKRPVLPHDEAMARVDSLLAQRRKQSVVG
jgi:hypothetical protein